MWLRQILYGLGVKVEAGLKNAVPCDAERLFNFSTGFDAAQPVQTSASQHQKTDMVKLLLESEGTRPIQPICIERAASPERRSLGWAVLATLAQHRPIGCINESLNSFDYRPGYERWAWRLLLISAVNLVGLPPWSVTITPLGPGSGAALARRSALGFLRSQWV